VINENLTIGEAPSPVVVESLQITPTAAAKLREVMAQKGITQGGLRVFVTGGGCSGLQYGMAFEERPEDDDVVMESQGMRVYVDPVSIYYLQGSSIDYVDSLMGGGFKVENPNAQTTCGCGHSFRPAGEAAASQGSGCCSSH
jgi:iron-sulfur cluster assembly protein